MTSNERRTYTIDVKSVAEVQGQYGQQWQIEFPDPMSQKGFPTKCWLDMPSDKPALGPHVALFERGRLKDGRDGSMDWHYQWRLVELDAKEIPRPNAPSGARGDTQGSAPYAVDVQDRMDRRTALMQAVEFWKPVEGIEVQNVLDTASTFYGWLQAPHANETPVASGSTPGPAIETPSVEPDASMAIQDSKESLEKYIKARGWTKEQIQQALGTLTISQWMKAGEDRSYDDVRRCLEDALDAEPPF